MKILRSLAIAFSTYSKIPMPQFPWEKEDMKYVFCFFPLIGAVTGAVVVLWVWICGALQIGDIARTLIGTAIPLLITGGIHADGFMDTMDAISSHQNCEKKLEILKDPHTGAFSVIMIIVYYMIYAAAFSEIESMQTAAALGGGFVLSRTLSGIGALVLPPAKQGGMLRSVTDSAKKRTVLFVLLAWLLGCAVFLIWISQIMGAIIFSAALASFVYYIFRTKKEFGGVTGDTAGYFLMICEECIVVAAAVCGQI